MIKLKNIFRLEFVIVFLLLSDLFIPSVIVFEIGMNLSLIAVPVIFIFFLLKNKNFTIARSWQILFVLLLGGMVWISSLWSYTYLGVPYSSGDFLESIKYLKFLPYLLFLPLLNCDKFESAIDAIMLVAAFIIMMVGFSQVFFTSSIGLWFADAYAGRAGHADSLLSTTARLTLTGSDPNVGGAIAACVAIYFFVRYLDEKKIISIIFSTILISLAILTQSRTVVIALIFSIAYYVSFFHKGLIYRRFF